MAVYSPIRDSIRFGYAVGRVRVLETLLLRSSHYERLLDARTFEDQKRVLSETRYGAYLETAQTAEDVEIAFDRALADVYADFLETANLPQPMVDYFRTIHDFENLRGRLKAESLGIEANELLNDLGSVSIERMVAGRLPALLQAAEDRVRVEATVDGELAVNLLDAAVDTELYTALDAVARTIENRHVRDMASTLADLANVRAFVRVRTLGLPTSEVVRHSVPGGTITAEDLMGVYRLPLEEAVERLVARPTLRGADPEALADPVRFDIAADALVTRRMGDARRVPVGPEPVVAYVMQRKLETSMLLHASHRQARGRVTR